MKRFLVVFLLAAALLGLLAAPALAAKPVPVEYAPLNVPILLPVFPIPGEWAIQTGLTGVPSNDVKLHQSLDRGSKTFDPANFKAPYAPVPLTGKKAIIVIGWASSGYGQVKDVPTKLATTVDITGPDGFSQHFGPADTLPYWTGPTAWDQWWTDWLNYAFGWDPPITGPFWTFNQDISAGVYWNHLWLPVGPFPKKGWYNLHFTMVQLQPINDLTFYDPVAGPWPHGVWHKGWLDADNEPGYDFYVGP